MSKVSGQGIWPSGGGSGGGGGGGGATTSGAMTTGAPVTSGGGQCRCESCKQISSGQYTGVYLLWEGVGGRCIDECTYIRQEDNKVFCMCEPGPIDFVKPARCPAFRNLQCSAYNKCIEGQGDCDSDYECKGDLVCGDGNCASDYYHSTDDCCERR